jgi:hypothetical protein
MIFCPISATRTSAVKDRREALCRYYWNRRSIGKTYFDMRFCPDKPRLNVNSISETYDLWDISMLKLIKWEVKIAAW